MTAPTRQSVRVDSGPVIATDLLRDIPRDRWHELLRARRQFAEVAIPYDCRCLVQFCNDADDMHAALGFETPEEMIRDGLGLDAAELRLVVEWLELNPQDDAVPLEAAQAAALKAHGGDRRSEEFRDQGDNVTLVAERGNAKTYTIARLRRDRPDLAERVDAGLLSAHAAALEAGFRKHLTPLEIAFRQIPKLTVNERRQLKDALA